MISIDYCSSRDWLVYSTLWINSPTMMSIYCGLNQANTMNTSHVGIDFRPEMWGCFCGGSNFRALTNSKMWQSQLRKCSFEINLVRPVRGDQLELNIVLGNDDQEQLNLYIEIWKKSSLKSTNHRVKGVSDVTWAIEP